MKGLFKRCILGTYIETSNKELLDVYIREIKNKGYLGGRSKQTMKENVNFKVYCKYLLVHKSGRFWQSQCKPKGCRPIKQTAIK
ncbi:hypothetical protein VPH209E381_0019 [Vibrio phage 209E38-1]